ncbi:NADPH-dependent FMN reductase [Camelimonas abortus]|uniref:NADPH-dependent FMN reductase n=1 Tax=Camelimonas abortus TaxID=1017184 RepID=A0ABV7LF79_9HYPH
MNRPLVVGVGGTTRQNSSSEQALRVALSHAEANGAETLAFCGADLIFPMYGAGEAGRSPQATRFIEAIRRADGVIIASPGYHGSVSGLLKNALDYLEDLRDDPAPYLDGRAVGCIVSAWGPQALGATLSALRAIIHALRGWPTPMAAAFSAVTPAFDAAGRCADEALDRQLAIVASQVVEFAEMRALRRNAAAPSALRLACA